jgi:hypothetical protein
VFETLKREFGKTKRGLGKTKRGLGNAKKENEDAMRGKAASRWGDAVAHGLIVQDAGVSIPVMPTPAIPRKSPPTPQKEKPLSFPRRRENGSVRFISTPPWRP